MPVGHSRNESRLLFAIVLVVAFVVAADPLNLLSTGKPSEVPTPVPQSPLERWIESGLTIVGSLVFGLIAFLLFTRNEISETRFERLRAIGLGLGFLLFAVGGLIAVF